MSYTLSSQDNSITYSGNSGIVAYSVTSISDDDEKAKSENILFNGTQYFYITNQMGDILAITDTEGNIVGNYEYDAWGKVLTADTDIAKQNPLRYRGYYYDNETGYYYLQSRYYDSKICRFINADILELAKISKSISSGLNIFAYCNKEIL